MIICDEESLEGVRYNYCCISNFFSISKIFFWSL